MIPADEYRKLAAELRAKAIAAESHTLAAEWDHLASCYLRLAEQADRNTTVDVFIEVGRKPTLEGEGT